MIASTEKVEPWCKLMWRALGQRKIDDPRQDFIEQTYKFLSAANDAMIDIDLAAFGAFLTERGVNIKDHSNQKFLRLVAFNEAGLEKGILTARFNSLGRQLADDLGLMKDGGLLVAITQTESRFGALSAGYR